MTAEDNVATVRRYVEEVWNKGNLGFADQAHPSDYVSHPAYLEDQERRGPADIKKLVTTYRAAFPDIRVTIQDSFGAGDRVLAHTTWHGTHRGEFLGFAPSGKQVTFICQSIHRVVDGQIVESWHVLDLLSGLQQLGLIPTMGGG